MSRSHNGIIQFVHDGMIFYYSATALKRAHSNDRIGFYFDNNNMPQQILGESMYGEYCYRHFKGESRGRE